MITFDPDRSPAKAVCIACTMMARQVARSRAFRKTSTCKWEGREDKLASAAEGQLQDAKKIEKAEGRQKVEGDGVAGTLQPRSFILSSPARNTAYFRACVKSLQKLRCTVRLERCPKKLTNVE